MQRVNGSFIYSPSDLTGFLACEHLPILDLAAARLEEERPESSAQQSILAKLGVERERAYLDEQVAAGRQVTHIPGGASRSNAAAATFAAMSRGDEIIYQATFFDGTWVGHADFLRRVDDPSVQGRWSWHYEVEDTKLARHVDPSYVVQLSFYSDCVAQLQGVSPRGMSAILGDGSRVRFAVDDYAAYFRAVRARFLAHVGNSAPATYPNRVSHCAACVWEPNCEQRRLGDDHLSFVAGITSLQIERLHETGISTLHALAVGGDEQRPARMERATYAKLRRQARLQHEQRYAVAAGDAQPYRYEFIDDGDAAGARGLFALPEPSAGDVFFDMEGDPYFEIGTGLEYLFGATTTDGAFHGFWGCDRGESPAHDRRAEKLAFEAFVDFVVEHRRRYPAMHVYHYANYEKSALQRLSIRHATRESEVDTLLRNGVLIDLYRVVAQALVIGQPSYSIKKVEELYGKRGNASAVKAGDESILRFEEWLATRAYAEHRDDGILDDLERYNRYDCESTLRLRDWLLRLRPEAERVLQKPIPFAHAGAAGDGADAESNEPRDDEYSDLVAQLASRLPEDFDPTDDRFAALRPLWLAQHLLEYHWRELKPIYWRFHDRCDTYADQPESLLADAESLIGLVPFGEPIPDKRSLQYRFRYPEQLHKLQLGQARDLQTRSNAGTIVSIEDDETGGGVLTLNRSKELQRLPFPHGITTLKNISPGAVRNGIARLASVLLAGDRTRYRAAQDVLVSAHPRLVGRRIGARLQPEIVDESSLLDVCDALDESYLFLQGPPGAGKTYFGARLIVESIKKGRRVGITANTHEAIHNLLDEVESVAAARGVAFVGVKKCTGEDATRYEGPSFRNDPKSLEHDDAHLVAGTAWAFGPDAMDQRLDVLFIDEAGQMSLPAALATMTAARNVVLMGDPLQLPQVRNARHPGNVGASVLEHLLGPDPRPIAPDRGVLLTDSYRMHPTVCAFVSALLYERKLHAAIGRERQLVTSSGISGTGLRLLPVEHRQNSQRSPEEAVAIADQIEMLLGGTVRDYRGETRDLRPSDIIVVAAYNAQVRCIRDELRRRRGCADVPVGTVDKFQGREAYVVFYSTAASTPADAPRGLGFMFDRQRFNVAVSRARALVILVTSAALLSSQRATSLDDLRVANAIAQFCEEATPYEAGALPPSPTPMPPEPALTR